MCIRDRRNGVQAVKTDCLHLHFLRSLLGVTAMSCMFYAWGHLPLAQSALLKQTMPLFVPIVAFFWMGERLSWRNFVAIGLGFAGVLLVLNPFQEAAVFNLAVVLGLFGAVMGGSTKVSIRRMRSSEEPALRVVFYFALFASVLSVIPAAVVAADGGNLAVAVSVGGVGNSGAMVADGGVWSCSGGAIGGVYLCVGDFRSGAGLVVMG